MKAEAAELDLGAERETPVDLPSFRSASSGVRPLARASAFDAIFREHAHYILRALPRLGVPLGDVDDVCQEVFLAVHKMLPTFEGRSSLKTWIYGIAIRAARNHRRRAYRRREILTEHIPDTQATAVQPCTIERDESLQLLDSCLNKLTDRQRELIVLFEIEELTVAEVAEATDTSRFTIYSRLYAARRELKRHAVRSTRLGSKP